MIKQRIIIILLGLMLLPMTVFAAPADNSLNTTTGSQGLTVSPPLKEYTIDKGKTITGIIKLSNPSKSIINIYPSIADFTSKNDSGDPQFLEPEKNLTSKYSLAAWVQFVQDKITLAPQQVSEWQYRIVVPDNAGAGGHYGSVMFSNKPPVQIKGDYSGVGIGSMIASLLLVNIPGNVVEQAMVKSFTPDKQFYIKPTVNIDTLISNTGDIHITPIGNVKIKNWSGKEVKTFDLNQTKGKILPEGDRRFKINWSTNGSFWKQPIGKYTAEMSAIYGSKSPKTLSDSLVFWMIPLWIIITVSVLLLLIIIMVIVKIIKKRRKGY